MSAEPSFSIVLATLDRAPLLGRALESLLGVDYPADDFELLVVDNGSRDDTREVSAAFARRAPFAVRTLLEPTRGLSAARNRGVHEARGRFVFFTDDDQLVHSAVLAEHRRVAEKYRTRVVQGRIELGFPEGRPDWLRGKLETVLGKTRELPEGPADIDLYGGNLVLDRRLFGEMSGFRLGLGKGRAGYSEDVELGRRLRARGERVVYAPTARIEHVIGADRTTPAFFHRCSFQKGYSDGLLVELGPTLVAGAVLGLTADSLAWAGARARLDRHRALVRETSALNRLGRVFGAWHGRGS